MEELSTTLLSAVANGSSDKVILAFANPEFLVEAYKSDFLRSYLCHTTYNLADGVGILLAARFFGQSLPERITGTDFTKELAKLSSIHGLRIFFLGGKPGIAEMAANRLANEFPGCRIVGTQHGYFADEEEGGIVEYINMTQPDFLMVCFGNPRQEEWIERNLQRLNVKVVFGNGGALDFAAGTVARAPKLFQSMGLEWFWRLTQDFTFVRVSRQFRLAVFVWLIFLDFVRTSIRR